MGLTKISVARNKKYFTFLCEGISLEPRKSLAKVIGGQYDGVIVYGVDGVCIESLIKEMHGKKVELDGSVFYAEKDGQEIKLVKDEQEIKLV